VPDASLPLYVVATPMRDEIKVLPDLVATMDAQTVRPAVWVIVDDGSVDGCGAWLDEARKTRPWLHVVPPPEAPTEYLGNHVAKVIRHGAKEALRIADEAGLRTGYLGVLGADMVLPANHYEVLIRTMEADPRLGITSSVIQSPGADGKLKVEPLQREDLPRGGTQFFRRTCLDEIGGIPPHMGYDGASNAKAMSRGWKLRLLPDLVSWQARRTSTREGAAAGYRRKARYAWFLGHHPVLICARTLAYSREPPHDAGYVFLRAWLEEAWKGSPRCEDEEVRRHYGRFRVLHYLKLKAGGGFVRS
jgi:glycosyltransferase involved in cell wall biosynthesis